MDQSDPPIEKTLGTPAQRALLDPLFRQYRVGGITLHSAINSVILLMQGALFKNEGTPRVPASPSFEPGLPSHPSAEDILARLNAHQEWAEQMAIVLWDEHARAAMRQAANNFELAAKYIRENPNA